MMMDKGKHVVNTYKKLKEERQNIESYWRDAYEFSFPNRGMSFINNSDDSTATSAQNYKSKLFDTTASDSVRLLASSMLSGLTPPNSQWFNLHIPTAENVPYELKAWLESSSKTIYQMIHSSNYDSEAFEFFLDIVIAGQCGLYIELNEDQEFTFEFWQLADLFVAETLNRKTIDTVYRKLQYTASQALDKFGTNLPDFINDELKNNPESTKKFDFIHCIKPRMKKGKQSDGFTVKTMPYESTYVCAKSGFIVKESGYHEFPVVIPRWFQLPKTTYAVGPLDTALPDIKTVNKIMQLVLTNGEIQIAPPLIVKRDGVLNPNNVILGARQVMFANDPNNIKPLHTGSDMNWADNQVLRLQSQIRKVMMADQLSPQGNVQMTATEISVRVKLIRQLLGPIYGRFQSEYLQPLIERTFGLALRAGILGNPPVDLESINFHPTYLSPLARAQRQEELEAMGQFEASIGQVAQVEPEVLDIYDFDKSTTLKADLLGVPVDLLRDELAIKRIRKQRAEQQQAEQQMMMEQENG